MGSTLDTSATQTDNQLRETYRFESTVGVCYRTASIVVATDFSYLHSLKNHLDMQRYHWLRHLSLLRQIRVGVGAGGKERRTPKRILVKLTNGSRYLQMQISWRSRTMLWDHTAVNNSPERSYKIVDLSWSGAGLNVWSAVGMTCEKKNDDRARR